MNTIVCPQCNQEFAINDAVTHQLEQEILQNLNAKHKQDLEKVRDEVREESAKRLQEQYQLERKQFQDDAKDKDERIKNMIDQMSKLTEALRISKRQKDEAELQMQKKLALEEEKIREDAQKKAEEAQHLVISQKEKQLQDALKANEEMRRKLQQGSQQTQGEVFELEFEGILKQHYPNDQIKPVAKGIKGGDIIQEVWDRRGNYTGKILWELKNTKTWSEGWIDKLKVNQRAISADEAVIISEVLPANIKIAGFHENVWITQRNFVVTLADTLRAKLIQLFYVKNSVKNKDGKIEVLYTYLSGVEFKHRVEAIVEAFTNMQTEIEKEKRYFNNKWARDEKNIRQVIDNTYGMHGDLKGIIGAAIPQIKGLDLLGDGNEDTPETNI